MTQRQISTESPHFAAFNADIRQALATYCQNTQLASTENNPDIAAREADILQGYMDDSVKVSAMMVAPLLAAVHAEGGEIRRLLMFYLASKFNDHLGEESKNAMHFFVVMKVLEMQGNQDRTQVLDDSELMNVTDARDFTQMVDVFNASVALVNKEIPLLEGHIFPSENSKGESKLSLALRYDGGISIPTHGKLRQLVSPGYTPA